MSIPKNKPNSEEIQKLINRLVYEDEAELEDIILACYSHVVSKYIYADATGDLDEKWANLEDAMEAFVIERMRQSGDMETLLIFQKTSYIK
jgi:hypothetical protein